MDGGSKAASAMDQLKGFRTFAMRTLLRAAHCLRRIQQHEHFVSLAVRAPLWAAQLPCCIRLPHHHRCLAMASFCFSIGLLVLIGLSFFFIDWKLPPPACPGTTGSSSSSSSSVVVVVVVVDSS